MSPDLPPRNRLLALEQELQSRRSAGKQKQKKQRKASLTTEAQTDIAAPNSTPLPASNPKVHQPRQHRPPAPETPPATSPWQILAARLTQNQPTWSAPPVLINRPSSRLVAEQPKSSTRSANIPPQPERPPELLIPTHPIVPVAPASIAPNPIVPNDAENDRDNPNWDDSDRDDETPLASWQDLARQIQRVRSPETPSPRPQTSPRSPISTESEPPDWDSDASISSHPSNISTEPLIQSLGSSEQETDSRLTRKLANLAQNNEPIVDSSAISAIVPANSATDPTTETALILFDPPEGGALLPQSPADRGTLVPYAPRITNSLLTVWRSQQFQRAIPWFACFILPFGLFGTQLITSTHDSQSSLTGDILCVPQKTDSRI